MGQISSTMKTALYKDALEEIAISCLHCPLEALDFAQVEGLVAPAC